MGCTSIRYYLCSEMAPWLTAWRPAKKASITMDVYLLAFGPLTVAARSSFNVFLHNTVLWSRSQII